MAKLEFTYGVQDSEPYLIISSEHDTELLKKIYFSIQHTSDKLIRPDSGQTTLRIEGKQPILTTIQALLMFLYPQASTDTELQTFIQFVRLEKYKQPARAPKDKSITDYKEHTAQQQPIGSHRISMLEKISKPSKIKFFKENDNSEINRAEAFVAALYRLFIGCDRAPKVRNVLNEEQVSIGVIADEILGWMPFPGNYTSSEDYIVAGLIVVMLASYILDEEDFHFGNFGFDYVGKSNRLDFDRSLDEVRNFLIQKNLLPINSEILASFPQQAENHYRVLAKFVDINSNQFKYHKWKCLLKFASLANSAVIASIAKQFFVDTKTCGKYVSYVNARLNRLQLALFEIPEFINFIEQNPNVKHEILAEFEKYNQDMKQKESFVVNIDCVAERMAMDTADKPRYDI